MCRSEKATPVGVAFCLGLAGKMRTWDRAPRGGAARLRCTNVSPQAKSWQRRNSLHSRRRLCRLTDVAHPLRVLPPSIANAHGYHKNSHTRQVWLFLCFVLTKKMQTLAGAPHSGAAHLRRTSVSPQAKPWRRRNSFPPSISNFHGYHKKGHTHQVRPFLWWRLLDSNQWPHACEDASGRKSPAIGCFPALLAPFSVGTNNCLVHCVHPLIF